MKVVVSNVLTVTDYPQSIADWCESELKLSNPEYAKKLRMGFWTGTTPKHLYLYEKRGKALLLPFGTIRQLARIAPSDTEWLSDLAETPTIDFSGKDVPLYPYQQTAVETVFKRGHGILRSPAGSGKTQMGIALIKMFGKRALWLTHTLDLLNQSKARAEMYIDKSLIGTITEGKVNIGEGVTFATVQTMSKLDLSQYKDFWETVITDEAHRCAGTPTAMTQFYKVLNSLSARHKIGLSATVHRSDGLIEATYALLGQIIYNVPEEAVGDKIMKVGIKSVATDVKVSRECLGTDGMLNYQKLISYLTDCPERNQLIANLIEPDRASLILSDRLSHLELLKSMLPKSEQSKAVMISGKTAKPEREQAIEDMRNGKKKYLFATYSLAKEGLDIPCLERLYMATPVKDYAVVTQAIGRIARTCAGKQEAICYDFVDDIGFLIKAYKKRCGHYRKAGAYFI